MGYHLELAASPPRPILWGELSDAGRALGWTAHDREQEVRLERDGSLIARVVLSEGEAWIKTPDDAALAAFIDLAALMGLRARGDEWESYRSLTDWYVHPNDEPMRARAAASAATALQRRALRRKLWDWFRIVTLVLIAVSFAVMGWRNAQ